MSEQDLTKHWANQKEKAGGVLGVKILLTIYRIGGRALFLPILYPVIFCYYLASKKQRQYSKEFFQNVNCKLQKLGQPCQKFSSFRHFLSFADMVLDKFNAWMAKVVIGKNAFYTENSESTIFNFEGGGKVFLCSHLGNVDALRAIEFKQKTAVVNAVFFTQNA